jgi:peptide/nickel transport system substrate-binding protein
MNDASNLYIGVEIADDDLNTGSPDDALGIYFDNNNDGVWQDGEDSIALYASVGFKDRFLSGYPVKIYDTDAGGTNDGAGAVSASGGKNYFEMSHPLKSADSTHDFQLNLGDTIRFDFGYRDGGVGPATAGYWPVVESTDASGWGRIKIAVAPPSVSLSAWASTTPTIDGVIDAAEWGGAATTSFSLVDLKTGAATAYTGTLYVMNDANNLYLAVKVADTVLNPARSVAFAFDNNNDHSSFAEGDDLLFQNGAPTFIDSFWSTTVGTSKLDTDAGGTTDGSGAVQNSGGFNSFELSHPLNSADHAHDFSLSAGSTVGFGFRYSYGLLFTMNKRWPTEAQPGWGHIVVASAPIVQDFSIDADPASLTINRGSVGSTTIRVHSISGFSSAVTFATSWVGTVPTDVSPSTPGSVTPIPDGTGTTSVIVNAGVSASTGPFTLRVTGTSGSKIHSVDIPITISAAVTPGCVIATATYGSELSPEVRFLRTFRDTKVMATFAGRSFMAAFNLVYYSFSPTLAHTISDQEGPRWVTKILLYPLIGILHVSSTVFDALSFAPEFGVITAGFISSALIGICYLTPFLLIGLRVYTRNGRGIERKNLKRFVSACAMSVLLVGMGEVFAFPTLMMLTTAAFVITTLAAFSFGAATMLHKRLT